MKRKQLITSGLLVLVFSILLAIWINFATSEQNQPAFIQLLRPYSWFIVVVLFVLVLIFTLWQFLASNPSRSSSVSAGSVPNPIRDWLRQNYQAIIWVGGTVIVIVGILSLLMLAISPLLIGPTPKVKSTPTPSPTVPPISVTQTPDGSPIGISDGSSILDENFSNAGVKKLAAEKHHQGNFQEARTFWEYALSTNPNDAETRIYMENGQVQEKKSESFKLIAVTTFAFQDRRGNTATGASRDLLQGAYVAQKTFNITHSPIQVTLLIANIPSPSNAQEVARQITNAAKADPTIVGIVGWPSYLRDASQILNEAKIPIISHTSLDMRGNQTGYFFSVAPSIDDQAKAATQFAQSEWGVEKVAIFYDAHDPHSTELAYAFERNFDGLVLLEAYSTDQSDQLIQLVDSHIKADPKLKFLYYAGYPADAYELLQYLQDRDIHMMGGDLIYRMVHCPQNICPSGGFTNLYFTSAAFPDEVGWLNIDQQDIDKQIWLQLKSKAPESNDPENRDFFTVYRKVFETKEIGNPYGRERANSDVILAYDATCAFLYASLQQNGHPTAKGIQQTLQSMNNIYGVSGHITFDSDGSPQQKVVLVLWPAENGLQLIKLALGYY